MNRLQKFQKENGLDPDGILGPNTLGKMAEVFNKTEEETAHFAAQIAHETLDFKYEEENLKYSASALLSVFGKYFTPLEAKEAAYMPQLIANRVYGNRMGNGGPETGDGFKYRGRGPLMLTGKNNYEIFANKIKDLRVIDRPELIIEKYYFESAIFFFDINNLWRIAEYVSKEQIRKLTKRINGGYNGLSDREARTFKYYRYLCG